MPPADVSPPASLYDLSENDEGGYNTIRHVKSGKGVKLLCSKSKVSDTLTILRPTRPTGSCQRLSKAPANSHGTL